MNIELRLLVALLNAHLSQWAVHHDLLMVRAEISFLREDQIFSSVLGLTFSRPSGPDLGKSWLKHHFFSQDPLVFSEESPAARRGRELGRELVSWSFPRQDRTDHAFRASQLRRYGRAASSTEGGDPGQRFGKGVDAASSRSSRSACEEGSWHAAGGICGETQHQKKSLVRFWSGDDNNRASRPAQRESTTLCSRARGQRGFVSLCKPSALGHWALSQAAGSGSFPRNRNRQRDSCPALFPERLAHNQLSLFLSFLPFTTTTFPLHHFLPPATSTSSMDSAHCRSPRSSSSSSI